MDGCRRRPSSTSFQFFARSGAALLALALLSTFALAQLAAAEPTRGSSRASGGPTRQPLFGRPPAAANAPEKELPPETPVAAPPATAQTREAMWIWAKEQNPDAAPIGAVYFRKAFGMDAPSKGRVEITADDAFELIVNGAPVGSSDKAKVLHIYDISTRLVRGRNIIAVRATNKEGKTAGLAARVYVQDGKDWYDFSTDDSWRSSVHALPLWQTPLFSDKSWDQSQLIGKLVVPKEAETAANNNGAKEPETPEAAQANTEPNPAGPSGQFKISPEFRIEKLLGGEDLGSLIALTFNEFGQAVMAREDGAIILGYDSNDDKKIDKVREYCTKIKNCQGLLALNGELFATGDGPDGSALYRLTDRNRDGILEESTALVKFEGEGGEHGPHALTLGPDGLIYCVVGNHTKLKTEVSSASPYRNGYEGDLLPRYEDPSGHAAGVKAPAGCILRLTTDGTRVELVAGGMRNAYDLCFNREGELFTHDSDHEADEGAPWYRQTRLFHVTPGADFGWRSGWSPRPDYYLDSLPAVLETGRGSPTGMVCYNHLGFPVRYHNALFVGDWSEGRIWSITTQRQGASYKATSKVFLEGNPLNVTDLDVGPEGGLYFTTGGRGSEGGLYRVLWNGTVPADYTKLGEGVAAAVRQPQVQSAWARQELAARQRELAGDWGKLLPGVARSGDNPNYYRIRALELMQLFGPTPEPSLLIRISQDKDAEVRAKAAETMGYGLNEKLRERLVEMLADADPLVRRRVCEALVPDADKVPLEKLIPVLKASDRREAYAARKLLECQSPTLWQDELLGSKEARLVAAGGLALMAAAPTPEHAHDVVDNVRRVMKDFVSDADYVDLMRVLQVSLQRGHLQADDVTDLRDALVAEYPTTNPTMNRELVRLLVYLKAQAATDRFFEQLHSAKNTLPEKLHLATHLRFLETGFTSEQNLELVKLYELWIKSTEAGGYARYLPAVARDFARQFDEKDALAVLANGSEWPNAALGALYKLPAQLTPETVGQLEKLDKQLDDNKTSNARLLQTGIAAVLARSADPESMAYLRKVFDRDPERRQVVAVGLAQEPGGENWEYLVRSLAVVDGPAAKEVMDQLRTVQRVPEKAEAYRNVIIRGLRLGANGGSAAVGLLEHWTGETHTEPGDAADKLLIGWQAWFATKYPTELEAKLPAEVTESKWKLDELMQQLGQADVPADAARGLAVFEQAQCLKCHKAGARGESFGPELSTLSKRYSTKEILESMLYPSLVISSQYAAQSVELTDGRVLTGLVTPGAGDEKIVLQASGEKTAVKAADIEKISPSKVSVMPAGLLNDLTVEQIADLMAFLRSTPGATLTEKLSPDKIPKK